MKLIGRVKEQNDLKYILSSGRSEFIAVYGRRRIGKTMLIREFFKNNFSFYCTGLKEGNKTEQLKNFYSSFKKKNNSKFQIKLDWYDAFQDLIIYLNELGKGKKVIFMDEVPWMATNKSGFLLALDHFWNHWASTRKDIILIICGSASSWINNKILRNKGGLHNRVTHKIKLLPFTLLETEEYLTYKKFKISRYEVCKIYMILGGIPFYLSLLNPKLTIPKNIDQLCFHQNGYLHNEYNELYASLFTKPENHYKIVSVLGQKSKGVSRNELLKITKLSNGGTFTKILTELEQSGFIESYSSFTKKSRDKLYKLTDLFTIFHLRFIAKLNKYDNQYWSMGINTPAQNTWQGFTYELVCFNHITQIKQALGLSEIRTNISTWLNNQAQIDLLIDRADNIINLIEIKFYNTYFTINKGYYDVLLKKISALQSMIKKRQSLNLVLLTTFGLDHSKYNDSIVSKEITLNDLFQ